MTDPISAVLLDDSVEFSLTEVCAACRVSEELVVEIVAEGIVEPLGGERAQWRFTGVALTRGDQGSRVTFIGLLRFRAAASTPRALHAPG